MDFEVSGRGSNRNTIPTIVWRDGVKERNNSVRVGGVQAFILIENLPITSAECN
jgi:hypothetical protein